MSRRGYIMYGIALLLIGGCEEGDGSAGGGSNQTPKANVSSPSNNIATASISTKSGSPDVFLALPSLAANPNAVMIGELDLSTTSTGGGEGSSAPSIDLGSIAGSSGSSLPSIDFDPMTGGGGHSDDHAMNDSSTASANFVASPEPVTAMLSLMGLGALGMAARRRTV